MSTSHDAERFVRATVDRYGLDLALSRARVMAHERKRTPKWLQIAIGMLTEMKSDMDEAHEALRTKP